MRPQSALSDEGCIFCALGVHETCFILELVFTKREHAHRKRGENMGRINVEEAAVLMEATPQFVRRMIQQEKVDWGVAVRMSGGRYTYYVSEERLRAWLMKGGFNNGEGSTD